MGREHLPTVMGKANKIRDIKIVGWGIRGLGKDKDGDGMTIIIITH